MDRSGKDAHFYLVYPAAVGGLQDNYLKRRKKKHPANVIISDQI